MGGFDRHRRSTAAELMDVERVTPDDLAACLRDLAQVNTLTLARPPTLRWLADVTRTVSPPSGRPWRLLDVGFGDGDMLRAIRRWTRRQGVSMELLGLDLNPDAATAARAATPAEMTIDYLTSDLFAFAPDRPIDLIVSSLFTHHLDDGQLVRFLRWMGDTAQAGWFVNDLHRHAIAFHGFRLLATVMRWHRFVRHDGPVSVARSFRAADWQRALAAAGLADDRVTMRWHFPFRLCVAHRTTGQP